MIASPKRKEIIEMIELAIEALICMLVGSSIILANMQVIFNSVPVERTLRPGRRSSVRPQGLR